MGCRLTCFSKSRLGGFAAVTTMCIAGFTAGRADAAAVILDNGVANNGHLRIQTDDFGSFADAFQGGPAWLDLFNPSPDPTEGELPEEFATFSTNLFFFVDPSTTGQGTVRGIASSHQGLRATYANGNLACTVTQQNATNTLPLSTNSKFDCLGGGVRLSVTLTQTVSTFPAGPNGEQRAKIDQTYAIKNVAAGAVELIIVKHIDEDMPWGGGATYANDDLVGADFAELNGRAQVYAQDRELITAALNLRTLQDQTLDPRTVDFVYYAGKQTILPSGNPAYPGGACPAYAYGTDLQIWNNYGSPNCWKNNVPGVGYNVAGISPQLAGDSHIGLQVEALIPSQDTYPVTFSTIYGFRPLPTTQIPPQFESQTVSYNATTGCGTFLWSLTNINPVVPGETPVDITQFYIDVEAGTGADLGCVAMTPPAGWTVTPCGNDAANGHRLFRFTNGAPIPRLSEVRGRLTIDTNGSTQTTNPVTHIVVPPLSVVMHAAQQQDDAACALTFGPSAAGDWSGQVIATAYLPVPSMSVWAKGVLAAMLIGGGALLVMRSRKFATA